MSKTYVPVNNGYGIKYMPVLVCYKHPSGYTFLIHPSPDYDGYFSGTYAPLGYMPIGCRYSIAEVAANLEKCYGLNETIADKLKNWEPYHIPLRSGEYGIEHAAIWQVIERQRFESKQYKPVPTLDSLPVGLQYPVEHYLHLSIADNEQDFVAYTPTEEYGKADRQVRLRFGKYLRKAFPELSDATIQTAVTELRAKLLRSIETLHFTTERDTINDIFETELSACGSNSKSCMHGKWDGDSIRPYHVYADSPDVALAYVTRDNEIIARSVVSTKNKAWIRPYALEGDETLCAMLTDMLKAQGYTHGDLAGNRLTKLKADYLMLPYLDGDAKGVNDIGKYWMVVEGDGEYTADNTNGTAECNTPCCERCENPEDECECIYCNCCEENFHGGCENCNLCDHCNRCYTHDACHCNRCGDCEERVANCDCDRCEDCHELDNDCECEHDEEETESVSVAI